MSKKPLKIKVKTKKPKDGAGLWASSIDDGFIYPPRRTPLRSFQYAATATTTSDASAADTGCYEPTIVDLHETSNIGIEPSPVAVHNDGTENMGFIGTGEIPKFKSGRFRRKAVTPEEPITMSDEQIKQNGKDILDSIEVIPKGGRTYVIAVAMHEKEGSKNANRQRPVACKRGTPFSKGYPYNQAQDAYMMECVETMELGLVPCVFEVHMPGTGWSCSVPLSEVVLNRMLSAQQKKKLSDFREKFPKSEYKVQLVQMLGCDY